MPIDFKLLEAVRRAHLDGVKGRPESRVAWNMLRIRADSLDDHLRICVLGAPGSGKSALIDELCLRRSVPRPEIGIRTDCTDWSQEHLAPIWYLDGHLAFIDAPGHGTLAHPTKDFRWLPVRHFHVFLFVVASKIMEADEVLWRALLSQKNLHCGRVRVIRNKSDALTNPSVRTEVLRDLRSKFPGASEKPLLTSATDGDGIKRCRTWLDSLALANFLRCRPR